MRKMKIAELVIDYTLYPRNNVDSTNVGNLVAALQAGIELPPIIIDKRSKRVVDGVHRCKGFVAHFGESAEHFVIEKTYRNDAELFADAMRYNASHGAKLDACDKTHCAIIGLKLGLSIAVIAGALNMPVDRLSGLTASRTASSAGMTIPLKRTVQHFAGRTLNKRQAEANTRLSGMNQQFYANQLIELLESKMIDKSDEKLLARLEVLAELLEKLLCIAA